MPSPFPGMDPYLEATGMWRDFHNPFVFCWREQLVQELPQNYEARIDEHVNIVSRPLDEEEIKRIYPDLLIDRKKGAPKKRAAGGVATLEPVTIPLITITDEVKETWIEIRQKPRRELVTVLELLSPSNKEEPGRSRYLEKRSGLIRQRVHVVELDLFLGGARLPLSAPLPPGDHYALVARGDRRPQVDVYAWKVRDRLPAIPIPLKAPDADFISDLGAVFSTAYDRSGYARSIDYATPLSVPLSADDLAWAAGVPRGAAGGSR